MSLFLVTVHTNYAANLWLNTPPRQTTYRTTISYNAKLLADPLTVTLTASPPQTPSGITNLIATVSGGTAPFSYIFSGPGTIVPNGNTANVSGLQPGPNQFIVKVSDATSQTATASVTVDVLGGSADCINYYAGTDAGRYAMGCGNTFLGYFSGYSNTSGNQSTFVGSWAGFFTNGGQANTFMGFKAGFNNTTGNFNTFMGVQAGINNTTGSSNFIMGTNAGLSNTTGSANFFLGDNAGGSNRSGSFNVYLGTNAGAGNGVNGDNNVSIGFESGRGNTGVNNTFVGFRADAGAGGLSNATAIGNNAKVTVSNAVVLGNQANVGIGTTAPTAKLEVNSGVTNTAGIKLTSLTSNFSPTTNSTKFLTVDGSGNVILANYSNGGREGSPDALWQRSGSYLKSGNGEAVIIGQGVSKTPAGYSLFVGQGLLAEKVKVAVKNTSDWSDYVFAPTYKLIPLSQLEQYINKYQHLPGIPSATQVVEQGIDLATMDAKLLEKIEELSLYSIQLEKANQLLRDNDKKQQAEIDELKRVVKHLLEKK